MADRPDLLGQCSFQRRELMARSQPAGELSGFAARKRSELHARQQLLACQLAEHGGRKRPYRQLFLAYADQNQAARLPLMAAEIAEQACAHLVRPVHVLQEQEQRRSLCQAQHELLHRMEQAPRVGRTPRLIWYELWHERGELGALLARELQRSGDLVAQQVGPERERQHLLGLEAARAQHAKAQRLRREHHAIA